MATTLFDEMINDWGWLNSFVWVQSPTIKEGDANNSWLSGKVIEITLLSENMQETNGVTNSMWRVKIQLDTDQVLSDKISEEGHDTTVIIDTNGSFNHSDGQLHLEVIQHRQPRNLLSNSDSSSTSPSNNENDLSKLQYVNEPEILSVLKYRYSTQQPFIFIGPILLSMNPFEKIELYSDSYLKKYIQYGELRNLTHLPPHVYKIADTAYHHMLVDLFDPEKRENQTIVITGDSGAGKTECSKYLLHYFCLLSKDSQLWNDVKTEQTALTTTTATTTTTTTTTTAHYEKTIEKLVLSTDAITESLGNAMTLQNDNSSRFGKYVELYYSTKGKIEGVSIRTYLLESTRVTHHSNKERNFHIFYQLYAGLSVEEKNKLGFESLERFHYLQSESSTSLSNDYEKYQQLMNSFDLFNISMETRQELIKVFIGILHTGNIEFISTTKDENELCDFSSNEQTQFHLKKTCELMGYTEDSLREIFCNQSSSVSGREVKVNQQCANAIAMRDRLARTLYYSLFKWIMTELNFVLMENTSSNVLSFIGILDIFGFENIENNSLEQLCINYTHEKMKNYYHFMIFEMEQILYAQEGLKLATNNNFSPKYLENSNQIDFFENPSTGLFSILNDSMKQKDVTPMKFLQLLKRKNENNSCFESTEMQFQQGIFVIHHYTIPVTYHVENILERNKGIREINFTTLSTNSNKFYSTDNSQQFHPSTTSSVPSGLSAALSSSSLLSSPSPSSLPALQSSDSTILEKSMSLSGFSGTGNGGNINENENEGGKPSPPPPPPISTVQTSIRNKSKTICSVYYSDVCDLIVKLQGTKSHFIICLKPNHMKLKMIYDVPLMRQQIQSYSILETSLVTSNFISRQLSFPIFFYKYRVLLYPIGLCSLTKSIFHFLHLNQSNPTSSSSSAASASSSSLSSLPTYRSTVIAFIDIIPITLLILQQIYPLEDLPSLSSEEQQFSSISNYLKVGQTNIFLLDNVFDLLERLYYLTTNLIATKLQRIWKLSKCQKQSTELILLNSLRYFNYFNFCKVRERIISVILIQRKFRQYLLRRRFLVLSGKPKTHLGQVVKMQSLVRGWLCRRRPLPQPQSQEPPQEVIKPVKEIKEIRSQDVVTAEDFFPLVEGNQFIKICRSGKSHQTRVVLTYDRRYLQWIPDKFSMKSPKSCLLDLADVVTLTRGNISSQYPNSRRLTTQPNIDERYFSLHTSDDKRLDLIAPSVEIANDWIKCLNFLIFDIYIVREDLFKIWSLMITGEGIKDEVDDLDILDEIIDDSIQEDLISIRNFVGYWTSLQDPRFPPRRILHEIDKCLPGLRSTCQYFTFQAFFCLMSSFENSAYDPSRLEIYHDMTQPLSHYFIHSSDHLNIISSASSSTDYLLAYQQDLMNGCRGIEIHCWDGTNTPIVNSYIMPTTTDSSSPSSSTSPPPPAASSSSIEISLEDVLNVIKKYAFVSSPYPLLLFIENHCSLRMQEMIAYYLLATFGDKIVPANEIAYGSDDNGRYLPSPEDLYERVIVVISDTRHCYTTPIDDDVLQKKTIRPITSQLITPPPPPSSGEEESKSRQGSQRNLHAFPPSHSSISLSESKVDMRSQRSNSNVESFYHPHLRELTTMISRSVIDIHPLPAHLLDLHNLLSFSEVDMLSYLSKKEAISLLQINAHHLSRVYSDNRLEECHVIDPIRAWTVGSSLVFIDYHNPPESQADIAALVSQEKFKDNGGCGYLLKPSYLVTKGALPFPPSSLSVHLLSAQWLPKFSTEEEEQEENSQKFIPRVTVEIRGLPQDNQQFTTETSGGAGRSTNPIWDEVFHLDIDAPDAAHLIFKVSVGNIPIGSASIPVSCLRVGFRLVELYSSDGVKLKHTTLTIRTAFTKLKNVSSRVFYDTPELVKYDESTFRDEFKFR